MTRKFRERRLYLETYIRYNVVLHVFVCITYVEFYFWTSVLFSSQWRIIKKIVYELNLFAFAIT